MKRDNELYHSYLDGNITLEEYFDSLQRNLTNVYGVLSDLLLKKKEKRSFSIEIYEKLMKCQEELTTLEASVHMAVNEIGASSSTVSKVKVRALLTTVNMESQALTNQIKEYRELLKRQLADSFGPMG